MLTAVLCLALIGLGCGLLLLHWMGLAVVGLGASLVILAVYPWNAKLILIWFALMTALQVAYGAGAIARLSRERPPDEPPACRGPEDP